MLHRAHRLDAAPLLSRTCPLPAGLRRPPRAPAAAPAVAAAAAAEGEAVVAEAAVGEVGGPAMAGAIPSPPDRINQPHLPAAAGATATEQGALLDSRRTYVLSPTHWNRPKRVCRFLATRSSDMGNSLPSHRSRCRPSDPRPRRRQAAAAAAGPADADRHVRAARGGDVVRVGGAREGCDFARYLVCANPRFLLDCELLSCTQRTGSVGRYLM